MSTLLRADAPAYRPTNSFPYQAPAPSKPSLDNNVKKRKNRRKKLSSKNQKNLILESQYIDDGNGSGITAIVFGSDSGIDKRFKIDDITKFNRGKRNRKSSRKQSQKKGNTSKSKTNRKSAFAQTNTSPNNSSRNNDQHLQTKNHDCSVFDNECGMDFQNGKSLYSNIVKTIAPLDYVPSLSITSNAITLQSPKYHTDANLIISDVQQKQSESLSPKKDSWCTGLERLIPRQGDGYDKPPAPVSSHGNRCCSNISANDDDAKGVGGSEMNIADIDATITTNETATHSFTRLECTKRLNMRRLRDRWWSAMAKHRLQRELLIELEQKMSLVRIRLEKNDKEFTDLEAKSVDGNEDESYSDNNIRYGNHHDANISEQVKIQGDRLNGKNVDATTLNHHEFLLPTKKLLEKMIEHNKNQELEILLKRLISMNSKTIEKENGAGAIEHIIEVVIRQNKPTMLRTILSVTRGRVPIDAESNRSPLIQSVELGHEECASIILSKQDRESRMLFIKNSDGNTALHQCCRPNGDKAVLIMLLRHVGGNTKGKRHRLSKLVTSRNKKMQTPLHLACQSGRNDLVEVFLTTCKNPMLLKLLSLSDIYDQTPLLSAIANDSCDVVVSLIMWRGNHLSQGSSLNNETDCSKIKKAILSCPLVFAAKIGNLNMIDLLIRFGEESGSASYRITEALLILLQSGSSAHIKIQASDLLMHAGGNPFQNIDLSFLSDGEIENSVDVATKGGSGVVLRSILSTGRKILRDRQLFRRKDPKLKLQKCAFFRTLESSENSEANVAMKNALLKSLLRAYYEKEASRIFTSVVLYENLPGKITEKDLSRLQESILHKKLVALHPRTKDYCFFAAFRHNICTSYVKKQTNSSALDLDRSVVAKKSFLLLQNPWFQKELVRGGCHCSWMRNIEKDKSQSSKQKYSLDDETIFLVAEGESFLVHTSIVAEKSAKLASAIRFSRMNSDNLSSGEVLRLKVSIPAHYCKLLIQHMYHGSICCGWPNLQGNDMCKYMLELMLVAEEFLISSLVQEIEMRLLSSLPRCFCWHCCQAVRVTSSDTNKSVVECLYCVDGKSQLVTANSAINVLGLTEYTVGLDYSICLAPASVSFMSCTEANKLWKFYDAAVGDKNNTKLKSWKLNTSLTSLKDKAILVILSDFAAVAKSPDFYSATDDVANRKEVFLQVSLNELRKNTIINKA